MNQRLDEFESKLNELSRKASARAEEMSEKISNSMDPTERAYLRGKRDVYLHVITMLGDVQRQLDEAKGGL